MYSVQHNLEALEPGTNGLSTSWWLGLRRLASAFLLLLGSACATPPVTTVAALTKISATGYASPSSYAHYPPGQQKLLAIRAARLDAYRNLAEQVSGFQLVATSESSSFATPTDRIRSHVSATIRGARVTATNMLADGNVEVVVEIELPG